MLAKSSTKIHVATITSAIYFTWNVLAHGAQSTNLLRHYSTKKKKKQDLALSMRLLY